MPSFAQRRSTLATALKAGLVIAPGVFDGISARIADRMAESLFADLDPVFLRWFYGRMGIGTGVGCVAGCGACAGSTLGTAEALAVGAGGAAGSAR